MKAAEQTPTSAASIQKKSASSFFDNASEQETPFFAAKGVNNADSFFNPTQLPKSSKPLETSRPTIQAKLTDGLAKEKSEQEIETTRDKVEITQQPVTNNQTTQIIHSDNPSFASTPVVKKENLQEKEKEKEEEQKSEQPQNIVTPVVDAGETSTSAHSTLNNIGSLPQNTDSKIDGEAPNLINNSAVGEKDATTAEKPKEATRIDNKMSSGKATTDSGTSEIIPSAAGNGAVGGATNNMGGIANPEPRQSIPLNASSSEGMLTSLTNRGATDFTLGMRETGTATSAIQTQEKQALRDSLPEIEQPTGLPPVQENLINAHLPEPTSAEAPLLSNETVQSATLDAAAHPLSTRPVVTQPTPRPTSENQVGYGQNIQQLITQLPTSDSSIVTSAGQRPNIDLSGASDPNQNEVNQTEFTNQVSTEQANAQVLTQQDFGENNVFPRVERETLVSQAVLAPTQAHNSSALSELPLLTGEQYSAFDRAAETDMRQEIDGQMATHQLEHDRMVTDSAQERQSGFDQIAAANEATRLEQENIQATARGEVAGHRQDWQNENERVRTTYATASAASRQQTDIQIDTQIATTNQEVETQLSTAENQAEAERLRVEGEAQRREEEAANRPEPSFWDRAVDAVSDFFDSLKEALNTLFDGLRAFVKGVIDLAKKAVNALIDLARDAIVGLIKAFGEALKALVDIAFAAFPEIAARINRLIDGAVDYAVERVNELAETLKKAAAAILDAVGAVLDTLLSAYQAVFNAILDVLEFLTVGLLRIMEGIANLAIGFAEMLPQFHGTLIEEFLGTNITEPLPNVERTSEEIATHQNGNLATGVAENGGENSGIDNSEPVNELATATHLTDDQVALEPLTPLELDADLIQQSAARQSGGITELGGDNDPVTTQQLQAAHFGETEESTATLPETASENGADAPTTEGVTTESPIPTAGDEGGAAGESMDFSTMTDDQKLDYFIGQMSQQLQAPTTEDAKDTTPPEHDPSVPYDMKTNTLSVGKRLGFVGRQMMEGARIWWSQNSTTVYLAMLGILIGGAIVAIFTGGAGLLALIPILLEILMAYFIVDALLRIRGHLSDFFSKSWDGQTTEGGKSLAKAIAVVISEFLLEYILKGVGRVLKRIKNMVRSTRLGRRILGVSVKVRRVINRGVRRVRQGLSRASRSIRNVAVRGRKFIIGGFNRLMARGARTLGDLRDRILRHFGFRRIWFEFQGRRFKLWAEFNARVLLSTGEIRDVDNPGNVGHRGTFVDDLGNPQSGIVLDATGNKFSNRLADLGSNADDAANAMRRQEFDRLNSLDDVALRTQLHGGVPSERVSLRQDIRNTIFDRANTGRIDANGYPIFRDGKTQLDIPNYGTHYPETTPLGHPHPLAGQAVPPSLIGKPRADIGHDVGQSWEVRLEQHRAAGRSRAEIIELENNADLYVLEERSSNRSRSLD